MKKKKVKKSRNPIAKNLNKNKYKIIPNKKKNFRENDNVEDSDT